MRSKIAAEMGRNAHSCLFHQGSGIFHIPIYPNISMGTLPCDSKVSSFQANFCFPHRPLTLHLSDLDGTGIEVCPSVSTLTFWVTQLPEFHTEVLESKKLTAALWVILFFQHLKTSIRILIYLNHFSFANRSAPYWPHNAGVESYGNLKLAVDVSNSSAMQLKLIRRALQGACWI